MLKTIKLWWNKHILGRVEAKPAPTLSGMSGWSTPNQAALAASFGTPYKKPEVHPYTRPSAAPTPVQHTPVVSFTSDHDDRFASDMLAIMAINTIVQRNDGVVVQATPEEPVFIGTAPAPEPVYATPAYEPVAPAPSYYSTPAYEAPSPAPAPATDWGSTSYSSTDYGSSSYSSDSSSDSSSSSSSSWD